MLCFCSDSPGGPAANKLNRRPAIMPQLQHVRDFKLQASSIHPPRAIHACVNVAFSVIGSVLCRFAWNSRHSKLIDIRSEDVLSPLGGGCHVKARRSSCFESSFTIIHWGLINTSGARTRRSLASRADVWPLLSLLRLPSPVLQTRTPHREETWLRLAEPR